MTNLVPNRHHWTGKILNEVNDLHKPRQQNLEDSNHAGVKSPRIGVNTGREIQIIAL